MKTTLSYKLRNRLFAAFSLLLLTDIACAHSPSFSEGLVKAQAPSTKMWGYLNKKGEWALPPKFDEAHEFNSGLALIKQGDQSLFINKSGKVAFVCKWTMAEYSSGFSSGFLRVVENGKYGFVDTDGKLRIAPEYDKAANFSEDLAAVSKSGKWGFIDTRGKLVVPVEWDSVGRFSEGLVWVSRERKTGFLDKSGTLVIPLKYSRANDFKNGYASVYEDGVKDSRLINTKGEVLNPPDSNWNRWEIIGENRVLFCVESADSITGVLCGIADSKGQVLVEPTWATVGMGSGFDSGLGRATLPGATRQEWGKTGYINRDGKIIIPYFDYTNWFEEGLAFAKDGDKVGYIDTTGKFVFEMPK